MAEPFKNLLNPQVVASLAKLVRNAYPKFPDKKFQAAVLKTLDQLELKDRAHLIGDSLRSHLPADSTQATSILLDAVSSLPEPEGEKVQDGWLLFPINSYLSRHGLESFDVSIKLIRETTKRFTAEFGIRAFLINRPADTLAHLANWATDPNLHVRRLVSEGTRPRLPWGEQIPAFIQDPTPILPLLEQLKDDPEEYVRRSVANNLNDISKDHPQTFLRVAKSWVQPKNKNRARLLAHASRTLVKAGHPDALSLLGFAPPQLELTHFALTPKSLQLGNTLTVNLTLSSTAKKPQPLVIDYRFHFVKANGKTSPKVFKGSKITLDPQATRSLTHKFPLKKVTTRAYYPGLTQVELIINGHPLAQSPFTLKT